MCVQFISVQQFAGRISATEKSNLFSNPIYVEILLDIVIKSIRLKSENHEIFEQTLTTLSSLTESSKICEIFLNKGGIDLCFSVLNVTILLLFPKYDYLELIFFILVICRSDGSRDKNFRFTQ
jgi:hypothetical protein